MFAAAATLDPRDAWLEERRSGIGSSEVAIILGLAPPSWGGPHKVWLDKRGALAPSEPAACMRYGLHAEGAILSYVAETHGLDLMRQGHVVHRHPGEPWALASPDALLMRDGYAVGVCEAKNYGNGDGWGRDGEDADDETVPAHVLAQVMHQMWVTDLREESYVAASLFGRAPRLYPVRWDPRYETHVVPTLKAWWQRHIVGGEPPPIDGTDACAEVLRQAFPGSPGSERVERPDLEDLAARVAQAKADAKAAEVAAKLAENELRAAMGNDDRIRAGAVTATRVRNAGRGRVDMDLLKAAAGERWDEMERAAWVAGSPFEYILVKARV